MSRDENAFNYEDNRQNVHFNNQNDDNHEDSRYKHRTTSMHRHISQNQHDKVGKSLVDRNTWLNTAAASRSSPFDQHADLIASKMEEDATLMEDTPQAEQLRKDALKDMPQCLTIKRRIKRTLTDSMSQKSKSKKITTFKRLQYKWSMLRSKLKNEIKNVSSNFELWYHSLKKIEGQFGSAVATYFRFFRWLFLLNLCSAIPCFLFIVLPQVLNRHFETNITKNIFEITKKTEPYAINEAFSLGNIFTGGGFFRETTLYFGYYTNETINISSLPYVMPTAYFSTLLCIYFFTFILLSGSMANSYRKNFIETKGGLKNIYAHKIFCGWDYGIATKDAAKLKASSIYHELIELVNDKNRKYERVSKLNKFYTFIIQLIANIGVMIILAGIGYGLWLLMDTNRQKYEANESNQVGVITAVVINVIMLIVPIIFTQIIRVEDYKNPRTSFNITLVRSFLLALVVIGILISYWVRHATKSKCWETSLGQEIYRLVVFDFLFSVVFLALVEIARAIIYHNIWKGIGAPEFGIARYTLQIIYNQTLFWVGLYFSPLLAVIVVIKLFFTWYITTTFAIYFCKPSSKSWRAAQTQTWFLIMTYICLLLVIGALGYIIGSIETSQDCGPFKDHKYVYDMIIKGILSLQEGYSFWNVLIFFTKPGVIALILLAMCMAVYYLRAQSIAQETMVYLLKDMLVLEAKDKEYLLKRISTETKGTWQYNLQSLDPSKIDPYKKLSPQQSPQLRHRNYGDSILDPISSQTLLPNSPNISTQRSDEEFNPIYSINSPILPEHYPNNNILNADQFVDELAQRYTIATPNSQNTSTQRSDGFEDELNQRFRKYK